MTSEVVEKTWHNYALVEWSDNIGISDDPPPVNYPGMPPAFRPMT
ncbi:MAG: hypothetical protein U9R25_19785 [Chloroflexota bacterium]|nr:hypothetical protein [Chloroflexota bacterium]